MLIRVRSKDGNFRFEMAPSSTMTDLLNKILETAVYADPSSITISNQPRGNEKNLQSLQEMTLQSAGLSHGDLLFVNYNGLEPDSVQSSAAPSSAAIAAPGPSARPPLASKPWESATEDKVDAYWRSQDGKISRKRDPQFCKHGVNGMCDYCMPLEPYDGSYHKQNAIKHLSYHAYLRKISPKSSSSSALSDIPPLHPISYKVQVPCPTGTHPSWPAGICTHCQPSAITLQSQPFRMVDHLEIASTDIIERFLHAWRSTGLQRFGWLIGHYEPYEKVPMGIKAVVEAVYEPPQQGELDGLALGLPWEEEQYIRDLSASCSMPLTIVGYIFTDLDPTPEDRSVNVYKRHPGSFFLSSLEVIFAATVQSANRVPCKSSTSGQFASRMVTAVLTGTEDGQIDISAYQVSEQACAMVEADMIEASVDPGIMRVKEEDRSQESARYVPDVFFSYKNEYGLEVKKSAKPAFPVEYLLVNVTHGFPQNPSPVFQSNKFSIENRPGLEDQQVERVLSSLASLDAPNIVESRQSGPGQAQKRFELAEWLSDYHLAAFLGTTQLLSPDDMKVLMKTISSANLLEEESSLDRLIATDGWQTLMTFTRESAPRPPSSRPPEGDSSRMDEDIPQDVFDQIAAEDAASRVGGTSSAGIRICPHCTFENTHGQSDCEVCGLPL